MKAHRPPARSFRFSGLSGHGLFSGVLAVLFAGAVQAALTEDAKPKQFPPDPDKHVIEIRREAANAVQEKMIAAAEAALPAEKALREAVEGGKPPARDEVQWWHGEKLGIRIPFAITGDAVAYYKKLVEGYGKQTFTRYLQPSSKLEYHAGVAFHRDFEHGGKKFKDVHVVNMSLGFSQQFAATATEAMEFEKHRTVVLDANGAVLAVFGDGPTEVPVMAI